MFPLCEKAELVKERPATGELVVVVCLGVDEEVVVGDVVALGNPCCVQPLIATTPATATITNKTESFI